MDHQSDTHRPHLGLPIGDLMGGFKARTNPIKNLSTKSPIRCSLLLPHHGLPYFHRLADTQGMCWRTVVTAVVVSSTREASSMPPC